MRMGLRAERSRSVSTLDLIASKGGGVKDRGIYFFLDDVTALNVNSVKMNRA